MLCLERKETHAARDIVHADLGDGNSSPFPFFSRNLLGRDMNNPYGLLNSCHVKRCGILKRRQVYLKGPKDLLIQQLYEKDINYIHVTTVNANKINILLLGLS